MKRLARIAVAAAVLSATGLASAAAPADTTKDSEATQPALADPTLPDAGRVNVAATSGIPFLALGELSYGFTDRFALGAIAAATPNMGSITGTMAFGVRPRGAVFVSGPWRSVLAVPVLFYPKVDGFGGNREPWMLARPTLSLERELPGGSSVDVVVGVLGVACIDGLVTMGREHTMVGSVWETAGIGASIPLSGRTTLFGEASVITRGVEPANDWLGGAPIVGMVGVATRL
ncbi:MAG TPA: hypothetical protein VF765_21960 [Polyangiaceae bacterium]